VPCSCSNSWTWQREQQLTPPATGIQLGAAAAARTAKWLPPHAPAAHCTPTPAPDPNCSQPEPTAHCLLPGSYSQLQVMRRTA
jgi:hypothetical protein